MDQNETTDLTTTECVMLFAVMTPIFAFATYGIITAMQNGAELVREIKQSRKEKKNQK